MRLRFRDFILDTGRRELTRGSEVVHLQPKAFELLQALVEKRPKAISQQALCDLLWPDVHVRDTNLHNLVYQIRVALEDRDREVIKTAYAFGFSFSADAVEIDAIPQRHRCLLTVGDEEFDLIEGENIVGRDWGTAIRIDSPSVSRHHARIWTSDERMTVEDLGSKNGTFVEGKRIRAVIELADGNSIIFGSIAAKFCVLRRPRSTETVR